MNNFAKCTMLKLQHEWSRKCGEVGRYKSDEHPFFPEGLPKPVLPPMKYPEVLGATQTPGEDGMKWFQGTADVVHQFDWLFEAILSGYRLYQMDYMDFIQSHRQCGTDIGVSCLHMDNSRASDFGLMKIGDIIKSQSHFLQQEAQGRGDLKAMNGESTKVVSKMLPEKLMGTS